MTLICEPARTAWTDWFLVDHGTNLENAEAVTRAITRRVAQRRRGPEDSGMEMRAFVGPPCLSSDVVWPRRYRLLF